MCVDSAAYNRGIIMNARILLSLHEGVSSRSVSIFHLHFCPHDSLHRWFSHYFNIFLKATPVSIYRLNDVRAPSRRFSHRCICSFFLFFTGHYLFLRKNSIILEVCATDTDYSMTWLEIWRVAASLKGMLFFLWRHTVFFPFNETESRFWCVWIIFALSAVKFNSSSSTMALTLDKYRIYLDSINY